MTQKPTGTADLQDVLPRLGARYGHREDVSGWDLGYRWTDGRRTDAVVLRLHMVPSAQGAEATADEPLPQTFEGLPLDIVPATYAPSELSTAQNPCDRFPVLMGGMSCGRPGGGAGTAGCIVIEERSGLPCLLSNWHVLAGPDSRLGDAVLQPAANDGGLIWRDVVAELGLGFLDGDGDAAIAPLIGARPWFPTVHGDVRALRGLRAPRLGEVLQKSGRSSRLTRARVDGIGTYAVDYPELGRREIAGFRLTPLADGALAEPPSASGDSGAVWYSAETGEAVGLHFAADPASGTEAALAGLMPRIARRLGVRLAGVGDLAAAEAAVTARQVEREAQPTQPHGRDPLPTVPRPWPASRVDPVPPCPSVQGAWPGAADLPAPEPAAPAAATEGAGTPPRSVSREGFLWPNLTAALDHAGLSGGNILTGATVVERLNSPAPGQAITVALRGWPAFAALALRRPMLEAAGDLWDVLAALEAAYSRAGIRVI